VILELREVSFRYPGAPRAALEGVSLGLGPGEFVAVLGPNGSGKTTLVRVALGAVRPMAGSVLVAGRPVHTWTPRALARIVAVVPQREEQAFPLRVRDAVLLGRYPHLSPWARAGQGDYRAAARALAAVDAEDLADRWIDTLSGGEYQRVRLARALAQEPRLLVLDEPTVSLDLRHEMELFERARRLAGVGGPGVLLITHHVNLAARFADRVLVLHRGHSVGQGRPADVLTRERVARVFEWPVAIAPFEGAPQIVPLRTRESSG